jgi:purine-binding chemotaxis protein CheW
MNQELQLLSDIKIAASEEEEFVTLSIESQLFAISVSKVQDVLRGQHRITHIPLAPTEIKGLINLRGRIVTCINTRECLGLPKQKNSDGMNIVVEYKNEFFSLEADTVGEVIIIPRNQIEKNPANLTGKWKEIAAGIYKMQDKLVVILDVKKLLKL